MSLEPNYRWFCAVAMVVALGAGLDLRAQEHSCFSRSVASVPGRPTVANGTDPTQCGVVELEYGLERQWPGSGAHHSDLAGGIRFGLTPDLDFHWFAGDVVSLVDEDGSRTGYGDNWVGLKYRFLVQGKHRPSMGAMYQVKLPTEDLKLGESGQIDHSFLLLVGRDIHQLHCDFNVIPQLLGRSGGGFDSNVGLAWATSMSIYRWLSLVAEPYGYTAANDRTQGFASVMAGAALRPHPRLYLDAGVDVGTTQSAPRKRVYCGVTYAIGNVYAWLKAQDLQREQAREEFGHQFGKDRLHRSAGTRIMN